jgi:hypothetical protein
MKHPVAALLAVATLAQGLAAVLFGRLGWPEALQTLAVTAALAGLVHQAWIHRLRLNHRVDMFLVMGVFGGLGMLAGWWIDLGFTAPAARRVLSRRHGARMRWARGNRRILPRFGDRGGHVLRLGTGRG